MKLRKWLENWDMTKLKITLPFLEAEWEPQEKDRDAAWDLYVELLTRTATQSLTPSEGVEATALESVHSLFGTTREIIRRHGRDSINFTKIAVIVLNQIVRPFTAKWHNLALAGSFDTEDGRSQFRDDLADLQSDLRKYAWLLADMAGVEDITGMERSS